jgi:cell division protein FtsB
MRKITYFVLVLVLIICVFFAVFFLQSKKAQSPDTTRPQILTPEQQQAQWQEQAEQDALLGSIATSTDGKEMIYTNKKYKYSFSYPINWKLGSNWFGNGGIQLFKDVYYTDDDYTYSYKIEAGVGPSSPTDPNNENNSVTTLVINGIKVKRYEDNSFNPKYNRSGGTYIRSYLIPLQSDPAYSLGISMYNFSTTTSDFTVLDNIIKSIKWLP